MSPESTPKQPPSGPPVKHRDKGIRIFTYPKVIFIFPTLIIAIVCGIGMQMHGNDTSDPIRKIRVENAEKKARGLPQEELSPEMQHHKRFVTPQNLFGILFLGVLGFNLLIMALDFPRFTIVALLLLVLLVLFFLLWLGVYLDLFGWAKVSIARIFAVANSGFYYTFATVLIVIFALIWITRWLDYWEIMPNEILHHHGPLSDLERYPTLNLKFDKEIPDVFEFAFFQSGRLVLHVTDERKSIVLDNVLFINSKEEALKKLMSRLEVRVTTDQEVADT
jgi:hypothetical protein